jgi:hypothetical protein
LNKKSHGKKFPTYPLQGALAVTLVLTLENSLFKNITSKPLYFGITFVKMTQDIMTNDELISVISLGTKNN